MARNRTSSFGSISWYNAVCTAMHRPRDLLYDLLYRYLHDKLAAYLKKQCPYLSGDDFEDVISLTLAKCLEDLPLFQNRSCLTTWAFRYGIHFAQNTNRKNRTYYRHHLYLDPSRSVYQAGMDPLALYIQKERNEAVGKAFQCLCATHRQILIWVLFQNHSFTQIARITHHKPEQIRAALSFCLHDDAAKFSLLLLPSSFCICPAEKIQPMKG